MVGLPRIVLVAIALAQLGGDSQQVALSIQEWEKAAKIDVGDFSEARLRTELPTMVGQIQLATPPEGGKANYDRFVLAAFTRSFLFWSRDQAGLDVTRLGEPTVAPNRFAAFLSQHQNLRGREVGELHVTSNPTSGGINVDGVSKGRTENSLVVSVGKHQVVITPQGKASCNRTVDVGAGETKELDCR